MKNWLITGCSTGLGRSLAREALRRGYHVAVTARNTEKLKELKEEFPGTALLLSLDVTDSR